MDVVFCIRRCFLEHSFVVHVEVEGVTNPSGYRIALGIGIGGSVESRSH